jgi:hypothetical protein
MARLRSWAIVASVVLAGCGGGASRSPDEAASATSEAEASTTNAPGDDPADDAVMQSGDAAPGYLDAVSGEVTIGSGGTIAFVETLGSPVPARPALPEGDEALGWSVCVDSEPTEAPVGFPFATIPAPCEFIVHARWDGKRLTGLLIDRRPLLEDRRPRKIPFEPILEGDAIRMTVSLSSLDEPTSFAWSMFTEELGPLGTDVFYHVDNVPDAGIDDPISWSAG